LYADLKEVLILAGGMFIGWLMFKHATRVVVEEEDEKEINDQTDELFFEEENLEDVKEELKSSLLCSIDSCKFDL
jgi:hypothetical protein